MSIEAACASSGRCFEFVPVLLLDWAQSAAQSNLRMLNNSYGSLATIATSAEWSVIKTLINITTSAWLGARYNVSDSCWIWASGSRNNFPVFGMCSDVDEFCDAPTPSSVEQWLFTSSSCWSHSNSPNLPVLGYIVSYGELNNTDSNTCVTIS